MVPGPESEEGASRVPSVCSLLQGTDPKGEPPPGVLAQKSWTSQVFGSEDVPSLLDGDGVGGNSFRERCHVLEECLGGGQTWGPTVITWEVGSAG